MNYREEEGGREGEGEGERERGRERRSIKASVHTCRSKDEGQSIFNGPSLDGHLYVFTAMVGQELAMSTL